MADYPIGMERSVLAGSLADGATPGRDATPAYSTQPKISQGEARQLRQRMLLADKYYQRKFKENYDRSLELYRGQHWEEGDKSYAHRIVINYLKHIVETKVASSCFNPADIITRPKSPLGAANDETAKRAVGYEYKEALAQRECKRAFRDAQMVGFGVVMTGWEFQVEDQPEIEGRQTVEGEIPSPDDMSALVESGEGLGQPPVPASRVLKDGCFARRLDPRSFRISPEASWVVEDACYCGYVELKEVIEVKADPRFKNTRQLKGSADNLRAYLSEEHAGVEDDDLPQDVKRVKLYHYYEKRRRLHLVFCDEHEKPLLTEKWYWDHERYPFRLVFATEGEEGFYPDVTPLQEWEHMQREINLGRSQLASVRQQMVPKWLLKKGAFTQADQKRFRSGVIGSAIETNDPNPASAAASLPLPQLSPDFYHDMQVALSDLGAISNLDQYSLGSAPTKRLTTSEVNQIAGQGGPGRDADRQAFEELCAGVATDFLFLLQQYAEKTRMLPIYDDQQQVQDWQPWTKAQIQGEFDLEVYVGSTEIKDQKGRMEEIGFVLQSALPYVQMGVIDPKPLWEQLLMSMPDIKNVQAIVNPPPPPMPPGMSPDGAVPEGPGEPQGEPGIPPGPPGMNGGPPPGPPGGTQYDPRLLQMLAGAGMG